MEPRRKYREFFVNHAHQFYMGVRPWSDTAQCHHFSFFTRFPMLNLINSHLLGLVFPPHCLHCNSSLPVRAMYQWCDECMQSLLGSECHSCDRCGAKLERASPYKQECRACHRQQIRFDSVATIGNYQGTLQEVVREMKRVKSEAIAIQLGRLLGIRMLERGIGLDANLIVPVPIHWRKRIHRGFHASALIATGLSRAMKIRCNHTVIRATRLTSKQGTLSSKSRIKNVKDSMATKCPSRISGKHIILVDDVATSCATANEAVKVLNAANADRVTLAVAARGVRAGE